jgi:hypothetical protein
MTPNKQPKRPYIAKMDEVLITRQGETAVIEYKEPNVGGTNLVLGPKIHDMSDEDILKCHNDCIDAQLEFMRNYKYVATEIPPGKSQVKYFSPGGYWTMRGDVLRGYISSQNGETSILVDDKEFTLQEFGKLLSCFEGWGMRIIMVPEDETHQSPPIEVKEPEDDKEGSIILAEEFISKTNH